MLSNEKKFAKEYLKHYCSVLAYKKVFAKEIKKNKYTISEVLQKAVSFRGSKEVTKNINLLEKNYSLKTAKYYDIA